MTNYVDSSGLHTETLTEIIDAVTTGLQGIYGSDINVDANSPDGQWINFIAQIKIDLLDAITQVFNNFSPTHAEGRPLDRLCAINGVVRQGATYSRTPVSVTATNIVPLPGLDTSTSPFTVADSSGNEYYLEETTTTVVGTNVLNFRAANAGAVYSSLNSITSIKTVTLGITAVINPSAPIQTGQNEETDAQLRARRSIAVSAPSTGFLESLSGALASVSGVTDSIVYENVTNSTDAYGIPGHSMWAIVDGGTDAEVATVIYQKRNAGCGMKGSEIVDVAEVNGNTFQVRFDRPLYADLYMRMTIDSLNTAHTPDATYLRSQIASRIVYGIYDPADFTAVTSLVKELDPLAVVVSGGVTNLASGTAVTFQDVGDTVTLTSHGLAADTAITFLTIVSTTGISTATTYYVKNPTTNTFQVSSTIGGAALTLTTNGSGTMKVNDSSLEAFKYPATIQTRWLLADSPTRIDITVL